jgi:hypothetical protein
MELTLTGVAGDIIREHAAKFKERRAKAAPKGKVISELLESMDPSVEARTATLIGKGEKPEFARVAAEQAAAADVPTGG